MSSNSEKMIDDGGGVWPPDDYTREWKVYWPSGHIKYHALYLRGETEGQVICYWDNGKIAQRGLSDGGQCPDVWEDFWENGVKFKETEYCDNKNFQVRWYGHDGALYRVQDFVDNVCVCDREIGSE